MNKLDLFNKEQVKEDISSFNVGDVVSVTVKIPEENKVRLHTFQGTVIAIKGRGISRTFTVRKVSFQEGIEKVFPLYSPNIEKIEVTQKGKVKRAKLFYLRKKIGKGAKIKQE